MKPKAKDLKTIVEDLNSMEYLFKIEGYNSTIVLDGKKVRIGFEGTNIDPFETEYKDKQE